MIIKDKEFKNKMEFNYDNKILLPNTSGKEKDADINLKKAHKLKRFVLRTHREISTEKVG